MSEEEPLNITELLMELYGCGKTIMLNTSDSSEGEIWTLN